MPEKTVVIDPGHNVLETGLLTWAWPPEKSGLSRAAAEIAQALAGAGVRVRAFTLDRAGRGRDGDVEVIGCADRLGSVARHLRGYAGVGHAVAPTVFRAAVLADHRVRPFDVVEATNWYAPAAGLALASRIPVVTRNSTPVAISLPPARDLRGRIDAGCARRLEAMQARGSAGLISNTAAHGREVAAIYGVAPPGPRHATIGLSLPQAIVDRGAAADYPAGEPIELLFVGRDEARKGFDALAAAQAILAGEGSGLPSFRLTIVGVHDETIASWLPAARARTRCFHRVPEAMLHDLLAAAHVVVAPSRYESFGLVYQEAMAFGRPIVACAEDPSARLFVGETGAGLLAERCDGLALAAAIRRLLIDPAERTRLAARSRAAGGRFTRAGLAAETIAAYRSAIASKGRSSLASSSRLAPSAAIAP